VSLTAACISAAADTAAPAIAGGVPLTFGENFARSATGRGTAGFGSNFLHDYAKTLSANTRYRYQSAEWLIDAGANASKSITWRRTIMKGHFNSFGSSLLATTGVRVNFEDIRPEGPGITRVFDANNREIDLFDLRNFRLNTASSGTYRNYTDDTAGLDLNVKRSLSLFKVPVTLQGGGLLGIQDRDHRRESLGYTYNPANPADPTLAPSTCRSKVAAGSPEPRVVAHPELQSPCLPAPPRRRPGSPPPPTRAAR
jgi:hypothetical protein